jgi:phage gp36-like protein
MAYCSQTDLENALGLHVITAVFDDDADGTADSAPVAACLAYGDAQVNSYLRGLYDTTFPLSTVPDEVKFAAVNFCAAYAARRRPDVVRAMNEQPWTAFRDAAVDEMKRYVAAMQRLPTSTETPSNVGTTVTRTDGDATTDPDDRTFGDMGDFT